MRIIKTVKPHRLCPKKPALSKLFSKNGCYLSILILLFQFFPSFLFLQGGSLVWALGFQTSPRAIDDVDEDVFFSPNGDGVQDSLLIGFITDGDFGDFRIIIDTHGPSGVGSPDGRFRADEDWVVIGDLGPGIEEDDFPKAIREAWHGNDFSRQQEGRNPHLLSDGTYRIQIEIDAVPNGEVNRTESGYQTARLYAVIDNTAPQLSAVAAQRDLSPNGDNITDEAQIDYGLSEDLAELELQFTNPSDRPAVPLTRLTEGNHSFTWDGADGLGTTLSDGVYAVQLHGTDRGGNVGTFGIDTIQVDTKPPIIAQLTPTRNSFQNTVEQIEAIFNVDDGSLIDVESTSTRIVLKNADGTQINGLLSHDEEAGRITFTLDRPLNSSDDNGVYTINISGADKAGNIVRDEVNFTFDNIAPTITSIATDAGELTPDTSATTNFTFLDVTLADNIDSRVNTASTIRLSRLDGTAVAGIQSQFGENGLRWTPAFPLASDGSDDGDHTITVQSRDRAGNEVEIQIPFIYDTQAPELASLTSQTGIQLNPSVGRKAFLNSSLSVMTATFNDGNGGGVDFSKTSIGILGVTQVAGIEIPTPIQGTLTSDEDNDTLEFRLTESLERRDGSQDGNYRIQVRLTDKAGNTQTEYFDIVYDTQVPAVVATTPTENETVSSLSQVSVVLNASSGIDFSASIVRLLRADGSEVNTQVHDNSRDIVSLALAQPLAIDGSEDGAYTIEITPVDGANNAGATVRRQFFVALRMPEIRLNTPTETRINDLTTIDAQLFNYVGPGLDFTESKSTITVSRNGVIVQGKPLIPDEDNRRLIWTIDRSLSRDGSADGEYTVSVQYTDLIGKMLSEDFILTFDSLPPTITVDSRPQIANPLTTERIEVQFEVTDDFAGVQGSGFDAATSTFELFDVNGAMVNGAQTSDGTGRFAFRSSVLPEGGMYTLVVTLADRAGNRSIPLPLIYDAEEPTIEVVSHIEPTATVSNVSEFLARVEATVSDIGTGIDFNRSLIQLVDATGEVVPGSPYHDDEAIIGWEFATPLTREGNFDGLYSLRVSAVDKAGYVEEKTFVVRYDTQGPTIQTAFATRNDGTSIELFEAEARLVTSPINRIVVRLSDGEGSGMDVLQTILSLIDPEGVPVGTNQSDNGVDTVYLSFNPLRADGSDDGFYRIQVTPTDLAGNTLTSPIEVPFFYGTREPEVIATTPPEFASVTHVTEVSAILQDHSGEGIDFDRASILLIAPDQSVIPGHQTVDEAQSSITWELDQPLLRDGSVDGEYTIQLLPVDRAGNSAAVEHTFIYDTLIPSIVSVTANTDIELFEAEARLVTSPINRIVVRLSDGEGSGMDVLQTILSLIDPEGVPVGTNQSDNGVDTVYLSFNPLRADGSDDGFYRIQVTPTDLAGNTLTSPIEVPFFYGTREPEVIATTPPEFASVTHVTEVSAILQDHSGEGIDFDRASILLIAPDQSVIPGHQTVDEAQSSITWELDQPLSRDGSVDGEYTIQLLPVDRAGNSAAVEHTFVYDTLVPSIVSVTANTNPPTVIPLNESTAIDSSFERLTIHLSDANGATTQVSGADLVGTDVQLIGPSDTSLGINVRDDGVDTIIVSFASLYQSGTYTLAITPRDMAGNVSSHVVEYEFGLELEYSTVSAVTIGGRIAPAEFVNRLDEVVATLEDSSATGLNLTSDGSTIVVTGPNGAVDGVQTSRGENQIAWRPLQLAADGSADGVYTVMVTPVNNGGGLGIPSRYQFTLDTQEPEVTMVTPIDLTQPLSYIGQQIIQIAAQVEDVGPAGLDIDSQRLQLRDAGENVVSAVQTNDGESQIFLTLSQPLATDGSDDGIYTVSLELADKAGNLNPLSHQLIYDTLIPTVVSVAANTDPPTVIPSNGLTAIGSSFNGLRVMLSDANGEMTPVSRIDLAGTGVQLLGPGKTPLGINVRDDGVDTIIVSFASLYQSGTYTLAITPRDMAGNVSSHAVEYEFGLELEYSTVSAVTIGGRIAPAEFVNRLDEVVATLEDSSATGLNLASDGSTIVVTGPNGAVDGVQTSRGENQIAWRPLQLAADGSADGVYTVMVTPVNNGGGLGIPSRYQFTLDTQEPEVTMVTPIDLTQPLSYIGQQIIQIAAQVEDVGPAGLDIDSQRLQLRDAGENVVSAVQTNDGESQIFLTLSQPLATDGSDDGIYTVSLELADKAGNLNPLSHQLIYDTLIPTVVSVAANTDPPTVIPSNGLTAIGSSFNGLRVMLSDANGEMTPVSRIDLAGTGVQLLGPGKTPLGINVRDDGVDTIIVSFASLYQSGTYTLAITPRDMAGNVSSHAVEYEFGLELEYSTVSAVTIGGRIAPAEFVNRLDEVVATLEDSSATGLNLASDGSTIVVTGPNGAVDGVQTSRGENQIAWRPLQLAADGSADGVYTVMVTPVNNGGGLGIPSRYQFTLDTQEPEVTMVTPIDLTQPLSYIGQQIIQIAAQVEDVGPAGLDIDSQRFELRDSRGNVVPAVQSNDEESQIFLTLSQPLATDGSDDGIYTVSLELADKAGNLNPLSHQLIYDTLIPTVVSVAANTDPPTVIPSNGLTAIGSSFNGLRVMLSDANGEMTPVSRIDLAGTGVQLLGPGKTPLGINVRDDGVDTIIVSFASLYQSGTYTLAITPRDMAGNVSSHAVEYEFGLELEYSTVSAVTIGGRIAPAEFVNRLDEVVATLEDSSATGLNLMSDGSTIVVTGPNGTVDGVQTSRGENQIAWRPLQLAADGSADGVYTVMVTPVNSGSRLGIPSRYQFTLDTQEPEVTMVTPIDLAQPLSYIGQQIIQIAAQVEDVGPAGLDIDSQRFELRDSRGNVVPAVQSNDGQAQIFLTLSQPLTADGSDDGVYTVSLDLTDKAGNVNPLTHQLVYDTQVPTLVSTDPTDGDLRSDDITIITANLSDRGDSGVDFASSALTLLDPTGASVSGVQSNDGNRKLTLQINGLIADGTYTIRVDAIDRAGNGLNTPFETHFTYSSGMPVVVSTVPKTTPAEEAFTNQPLRQVEIELQLGDGDVNRSTIALLAPDGTTVPGQQVRQGKKLIYQLLRELATDGSDDGTYTIVVVPVNSAGRQGAPEQFSFVYDTVAPEIEPESIQLIVAEPGVNNSLVSLGALITDDEPSSGVDWDNLDSSWIMLDDVSRKRKIDGTLATDEEQALLLNLIMPLASDGSQDGIYQLVIAPKDRAGNVTPAIEYLFFYDTRPPVIDTESLFIDGQPLLTDANDLYYPSATSRGGGVTIDAKFFDVNPDGSPGLGPDLVNSSITVRSPSGNDISGTTTQNGTDSIRFKSGPLDEQGLYQVTITSVGLDIANLGFQPTDSVTTQFLFETTKPVVELTDVVGETTFEDEPLPLQGTARDPSEDDIPASDVALVEVVGTGPDGLPIEPVAAKDDSEEEEEPWTRWSVDFLPSQSGEYNLDMRVTDRAGNAGIYDATTVNFSVSLIFKGPTYVWPNPLSLSRRSNDEIANFSFEVNVPGGEGARIVLSVYDFAGDLVYEREYNDLDTGRSDNEVTWDLTNQSGTDVARGIYIFRLEAEDIVTSNRTNAVGKIVVVE